MSKRNSDREQTKKLIIEAASELFNKKGVLGTSLSDIEKATKLSKGSIYGNFKNKEEVALASFRYNYQLLKNGISEKTRIAKTYRGKLLGYIEFYRENYDFHRLRGGCPILNAGIDADDANQEILDEVNYALKEWESFIIRAIQRGKEKGEWKETTNADEFATLFISLIEGGIFLAKTTNQLDYLFRNLDFLEKKINEL